jgi:hypothetical protein
VLGPPPIRLSRRPNSVGRPTLQELVPNISRMGYLTARAVYENVGKPYSPTGRRERLATMATLKDVLDPGAEARWAALMYPNTPKPADETDVGKKRLRAYHLALGRFVDTYAHTELLTHLVLRRQTKTSSDAARAVFSGVRTNEALGYFRRLADVGVISAEEWSLLSPVVDQLRLITGRRNDLLHHAADCVASGKGIVSNDALALTVDRVQSFPISSEILDEMTRDLQKINAHFLLRHMGRPSLRGKHPELQKVLTASWRYTPPEKSPRPTPPKAKKKERRSRRK